MVIESIDLKNFRNYGDLHIDFDRDVNILYGDNGQGKTNVLEALYLCSTGKSHRGAKDFEMIRFAHDESHIKLTIRKNGLPLRLDVHIKRSKPKGVAVNGVPIRKISELFGMLHVVFFSPEDLSLVKNGPGERRRFMDMELCQMDKLYLHYLIRYNRIVFQRNKLLKEIERRPDDKMLLDVWDEELVNTGKEIIAQRAIFLKELGELAAPIHEGISGGKEKLSIVYEPSATPDSFAGDLARGRKSDIRQGMTMTGPHRDDICFLLDGKDARRYASQGQQRSVALSLKLSEIELVKKTIKDFPVLLLDDVFSELDAHRQNDIFGVLGQLQTIITCTGMEDMLRERTGAKTVFKVAGGDVRWESKPA
ncbi:MAG: DNA replication/repair protein RecF [Lachnospiraceae bacterium]|jgi:DNA replication and repair protein RecF|nr:DNA replication/repair protein RecF [Lachnospiraceae bacterium]